MAKKSSVSLTDRQHAFAKTLARAALRELLARRREGEFVPAEGMDRHLSAVIAAKRRSHGLPS